MGSEGSGVSSCPCSRSSCRRGLGSRAHDRGEDRHLACKAELEQQLERVEIFHRQSPSHGSRQSESGASSRGTAKGRASSFVDGIGEGCVGEVAERSIDR